MDTWSFFATALFTLILVLSTLYYSFQSKKQLEKNLEETKIEVAMASRPLMVIRAVVHEAATTYDEETIAAPKGAQAPECRAVTSHFSHFELFNAGNSPAIDLEFLLLSADKKVLQGETLGFLRNNEPALTFVPVKMESNKPYYLVCEYESIRSRSGKIWYQTWLPFTPVDAMAKGTINMNVNELDFRDVSSKERLDVFKAEQKQR